LFGGKSTVNMFEMTIARVETFEVGRYGKKGKMDCPSFSAFPFTLKPCFLFARRGEWILLKSPQVDPAFIEDF